MEASGGFWCGPSDDANRYHLTRIVSGGGEGILYRGELAQGFRPTVAVKVLRADHAMRDLDRWVRRWNAQVQTLRSLSHPAIVGVREGFLGPSPHGFDETLPESRSLYLVMNWVDGRTLTEWVHASGDRSPAARLAVLAPIADALALMHSGIQTNDVAVVHRDVKPSNIIVTPDGSAVLVDFGIAATNDHETGVAGTVGYQAPECADGVQGPPADVYGLGGVAHFAITGQHPPRDLDGFAEGLRAAGLNDQLQRVVMSMRSPQPQQRPAAAELRFPTEVVVAAPLALASAPKVGDRQALTLRLLAAPKLARSRRAWLVLALVGSAGAAVLVARSLDGEGAKLAAAGIEATANQRHDTSGSSGADAKEATNSSTSFERQPGHGTTAARVSGPAVDSALNGSSSGVGLPRPFATSGGQIVDSSGAPLWTIADPPPSRPTATAPSTSAQPPSTPSSATTPSHPISSPTSNSSTTVATSKPGIIAGCGVGTSSKPYLGPMLGWVDHDGDCVHSAYEIHIQGTIPSDAQSVNPSAPHPDVQLATLDSFLRARTKFVGSHTSCDPAAWANAGTALLTARNSSRVWRDADADCLDDRWEVDNGWNPSEPTPRGPGQGGLLPYLEDQIA